jgi:hypothetical protein
LLHKTQNAIDLDQATIEEELASENFDAARYLYEDGAHSKSFAELTLTTELPKQVEEDTVVTGLADDRNDVKGKFLKTYPAGATVIQVQYHEFQIQDSYSNCQVGALTYIFKANRRGCESNLTCRCSCSVAILYSSFNPHAN